MQTTTRSIFFIFVFLFSFQFMNSQVSASFHTNSHFSKIGVGYDFNESLWTELRVHSGTFIESITPEIVLNYNFVRKEVFESYLGGGVVLNGFNGILGQAGLQIKPFENLRSFSFIIEAQPQYNWDYEDVIFNGFGGIRYKFN